jgi:hypothetical protein
MSPSRPQTDNRKEERCVQHARSARWGLQLLQQQAKGPARASGAFSRNEWTVDRTNERCTCTKPDLQYIYSHYFIHVMRSGLVEIGTWVLYFCTKHVETTFAGSYVDLSPLKQPS